MKEIASGVIGALVTAFILWAVGVIKSVEVGVPEDVVLAFKSESCPKDWKPWDKTGGRFLRGIDYLGEGVDPEAKRSPGSHQNESVSTHDHYFPNVYQGADGSRLGTDYGAMPHHPTTGGQPKRQTAQRDWKIENESLGVETRPDNVAVLFCVKK